MRPAVASRAAPIPSTAVAPRHRRAPLLRQAAGEQRDLFIGEGSAFGDRERGHRRAFDPVSDHAFDLGGGCDRQIDRVVQRCGGPSPAVPPVAAGTIRRVERPEVRHLLRLDVAILFARPSGERVARERADEQQRESQCAGPLAPFESWLF